MLIFRWILGAILIILILGFALYNQEQTVSIQFLKWKSPVLPLYFFLYLSYAAGLLTWVVVSAFSYLKQKGDIYKLQRENRRILDELNRLRNAGIEDEMEATELEEHEEVLED